MKEQNIDQLFRQKLKEHSVTPTPAAWDQVAQGLQGTRRRKRGAYYAAAAVLALLFTTAWLMLQPGNTLQPQQIKPLAVHVPDNTIPESSVVAVAPQQQQEKPAGLTAAPAAKAQSTQPENSNSAATAGLASRSTFEKSTARPKAAPIQEEIPELPLQETQQNENEALLAQALPVAPESQTTGRITEEPQAIVVPAAETLLAKAEDVVIRYQSASVAEAKPEKGSDKVLSFLQKVKQGEIGLADVRQAKDNLLSGRSNANKP